MSTADLIAEGRDYAHKGKLPAPAHALILGLADALEAQCRTAESVVTMVEPIIERSKDQIGTHSPTCHEYHHACLAVAVRARLQGSEQKEAEPNPNLCPECSAHGLTGMYGMSHSEWLEFEEYVKARIGGTE